jgi:hypothetical protein
MRVWESQGGARGLIVIEAARGGNNQQPGTNFPVTGYAPFPPFEAPSLQLEATRPLGVPPKVGSLDVCDTGLPPPQGIGGGIPAINPPSFDLTQFNVNAWNDYACRFTFSINSGDACSRNASGNTAYLGQLTRVQYCYNADQIAAFQEGDTILTLRVLDHGGVPGPTAQIKVRVPTPTP